MTTTRRRAILATAALAPTLFAAALIAGASAAPAAAAPAAFPQFDHTLHANSIWAGYADTGKTYSSVTGDWTVPSLNCSATKSSAVSPWIGIDGFSSSTVEQIGFDQDCKAGVASYHPWVEMYPAGSIYFTETVKAGDHITASVSVSGTTYTLTEADTTQGWTKTYHKSGNDKRNSAEAILEDLGSNMPPVADFGKVAFTSVTANGAALANAGTPNSTNLERGTTLLTKNSALSGGDFTITWLHA